ncbi:MAG: hypothetical protein KDA71_00935, partial [Planctomycetales bacterium]|nr:hypothetical protein [Planctomycetales bacterium]
MVAALFGSSFVSNAQSADEAPAKSPDAESEPTREQQVFFEQHVRPLLVERCYECHGPEKQKGDLRVDSRAALLVGGESGPAVVPGDSAASLLIEAVNYESFE